MQIRGLHFTRGSRKILNGVSLGIHSGYSLYVPLVESGKPPCSKLLAVNYALMKAMFESLAKIFTI